ncbi:hypothetical protein NQ317_019802 [Molorchus minor]|uniref:acid phosphatase n=1 Tax=Molorchus minor TaxID=1323400 RepID=A0ABQ9JCZ2_9CUCU|nr:hypothetical protein NQ317_019802 [Molorchus minor]
MQVTLLHCLVVVGLVFATWGAEDKLDAVVVIYRHGDRTPIRPYPTDPYRNTSYWPVDFGQLTNTGKVQQLELGRWLRDRYNNFLPNKYSEKDIYIQSTDVDRTLMLAEANLAGLYPPVSSEVWDDDIKWQPIPIHTIPEKEDAVLAGKKTCPKYNELQKQLFKSDYFRNVSHINHDLYAYLTRYTGETVSTLETLEFIYSTLLIETVNNYTLPEWGIKRRRNNGRNYVRVFYKNTSEARQMQLPSCGLDCDLVDFIRVLKPITIDLEEWEKECNPKWSPSWPLSFEGNIILMSILIGIVLMTTGIIIGLKRAKKDSETNYIQLPNEEYA